MALVFRAGLVRLATRALLAVLALWARKARWVLLELLVQLARPAELGTLVRLVQRERVGHAAARAHRVCVDRLVPLGKLAPMDAEAIQDHLALGRVARLAIQDPLVLWDQLVSLGSGAHVAPEVCVGPKGVRGSRATPDHLALPLLDHAVQWVLWDETGPAAHRVGKVLLARVVIGANWATQVTRVSMDRGVGQARKDTVVKLVEGAHRVLLDSLDPLAIRVRGVTRGPRVGVERPGLLALVARLEAVVTEELMGMLGILVHLDALAHGAREAPLVPLGRGALLVEILLFGNHHRHLHSLLMLLVHTQRSTTQTELCIGCRT